MAKTATKVSLAKDVPAGYRYDKARGKTYVIPGGVADTSAKTSSPPPAYKPAGKTAEQYVQDLLKMSGGDKPLTEWDLKAIRDIGQPLSAHDVKYSGMYDDGYSRTIAMYAHGIGREGKNVSRSLGAGYKLEDMPASYREEYETMTGRNTAREALKGALASYTEAYGEEGTIGKTVAEIMSEYSAGKGGALKDMGLEQMPIAVKDQPQVYVKDGRYRVKTKEGKEVLATSKEGLAIIKGYGYKNVYDYIEQQSTAIEGSKGLTSAQLIKSNAKTLADYVLGKGLTNLENYTWWKNNPNKQEAWSIIQQSQAEGEGGQKKSIADIEDFSDANDYINQGQIDDYEKGEAELMPPTKGGIKETFDLYEELLEPEAAKPEAFSVKEELERLREEYGVEEIEGDLNYWKAQEEEILERRRERMDAQEGKQVPLGVIAGRQSEIARQEQKELDFIGRMKTKAYDELQTKYGVIEMMMNAAQTDFKNASDAYNNEYNQRMNMANFVRGVMGDERTAAQRSEDKARANFEIAIKQFEGTNYGDLTTEQQSMLNKLASEAGIPTTLVSGLLRETALSDIVSTSSRMEADGKTYVDFIMRDKKTGEMSVQSIFTGVSRVPSSGGSTTENKYKSDLKYALKTFGDDPEMGVTYMNVDWPGYSDITQATFDKAWGITPEEEEKATPKWQDKLYETIGKYIPE